MIAKLVTHAPTREKAIDAQADALDAFAIDGIRHNVPFLAALMAHPRWRSGKLSTGFIAEEFKDGFHPQKPEGEKGDVLAAVAAAVDYVQDERKRQISGQMNGRGWVRDTDRVVVMGALTRRLEATRDGDAVNIRFEGKKAVRAISSWRPGNLIWSGTVGATPASVQVRAAPNGLDLSYRGVQTRAYVYTESEAAYAALMPEKKVADTGKQVKCPMPGLVVSIAVKEGQEVKAGEQVAVVEAMKMENVLRAEIDGKVKKIHAKKGDSLAVDAVILEFD